MYGKKWRMKVPQLMGLGKVIDCDFSTSCVIYKDISLMVEKTQQTR